MEQGQHSARQSHSSIQTMKPLVLLTTLTILAVPSFAQTPERRAESGADAPASKPYIYKHGAGKPRQMEIFFPPGHDPAKAKVPGMILFHGGSWVGGTLTQFHVACAYFASHGIVCATAGYQKLNAADATVRGEVSQRLTMARGVLLPSCHASSTIRNARRVESLTAVFPARSPLAGKLQRAR
jgi:hypothetical protein